MKRDWWVVLPAFLGGIVLTNLLGSDLLAAYGILNEYFLCQYSYQKIDANRLFAHVLMERCQTAVFIYLLGKAMRGRTFALLTKGAAAAGFGFLIVVGIVNLGLRGLAVVCGGLFPQWICYLTALFGYANLRRQEEEYGAGGLQTGGAPRTVAVGILLIFGVLLGVVLESWINPLIFGAILKLF